MGDRGENGEVRTTLPSGQSPPDVFRRVGGWLPVLSSQLSDSSHHLLVPQLSALAVLEQFHVHLPDSFLPPPPRHPAAAEPYAHATFRVIAPRPVSCHPPAPRPAHLRHRDPLLFTASPHQSQTIIEVVKAGKVCGAPQGSVGFVGR
jgi:hypothetical protein